MNTRPIGVLVFPTRLSEKIRSNETLIHYRIPPREFDFNYSSNNQSRNQTCKNVKGYFSLPF